MPSPSTGFVRVGGHTSCVAITADGDQVPRLVLDAGTGLRRLSTSLGGRPFHGTLMLGHLYWDHTQGLPFFSAGDDQVPRSSCSARPGRTRRSRPSWPA